MSRSLQRGGGAFLVDGALDLLTVPAGHKYELIDVSLEGNSVDEIGLILYYTALGGGTVRLDWLTTGPGVWATHHAYNGLVAYAGETLSAYVLLDGAAGANVTMQYVDVDFGAPG